VQWLNDREGRSARIRERLLPIYLLSRKLNKPKNESGEGKMFDEWRSRYNGSLITGHTHETSGQKF
jgi:hypothetical protein